MHHPHRDIDFHVDLEATMRDGTVLRADAYRPTGSGPWPVLLARTPYGKQDPAVLARLDPFGAARRGYLVVIQDCRGRFRSQGHWQPLAHESTDGHDAVEWAAHLPDANGRVGMYGPSYLGYTQWAAISAQPPHLYVAAPELTWSDPDDGLLSRGGAVELGLVTHWTLTLGVNVLERRNFGDPVELRRQLAALNTALNELATHTYWELPAPASPTLRRLDLPTPTSGPPTQLTTGEHAAHPGIPTLTVAGWFDCFLQGSLDNYVRSHRAGAPAALIVGPWSHENQTGRIGESDFGATADAAGIENAGSLLERELDWFDRYLKQQRAAPVPLAPDPPAPVPPAPEPPVLLFVMGANQWRRFQAWPPESIDSPWYLHADSRLSPEPPEPHSSPDLWHHDPDDPVPTCGGSILMAPGFPAGPLDQQQIEKRDDVLVYTSEPLDAPLEVIGRVSVHLVADSSTPAADWVARLCDVDTDGVSWNITDGILRTEQAHPERTGLRAQGLTVDLWSTAHVFLPGHRIRLQITSSCFPRWDRNPADRPMGPDGRAAPGAPGVQTSAARRSVYQDAARPSRLVLPVVQQLTVPGRPSPSSAEGHVRSGQPGEDV
ncbi:putative CocE/NonD family hydrolase [Streptacidiphilus sp. MAP12-16]|uniref:CocE/NonD family hydrolase n=1 Tax=Streptacidiphilus sp. MAP12-16 TaxID=3156300 RepID=UPI003519580A